MEPGLTKRKNTVKNKPIRHFSHGCQLYASLLTASSPQIYREIIKRKPVDNRNYLDIKLLDLVKLNTIHGYRALKYSRFTNSGGPAAVVGYHPELKVVELSLPEYPAAGLLGGLVRKVSKMIVVGWHDNELIHGSLDGWGNGGMGEWRNKCMVTSLLRSFLIVNCQLLIVNCEFKTRRKT